MTTATAVVCYDCGHNKDVHHETSCDLCTACKGFVEAEEMTINLAPPSSVYSPHVRVLKGFVEELSRKLAASRSATSGTAGIEYRRIILWLDENIEDVRKAAGDVLTDDFLLIVDGKRFPGGPRQDR